MPFTVDEEKLISKPGATVVTSLDPAKPPVREIPHMEFPRVVYKHPREPFRKIIHRNNKHEIVEEEIVPSEHMAMIVKDKDEFDKATREGWVKKPYIPKPPEDPNHALYAPEK